jgi:hypothetical protein
LLDLQLLREMQNHQRRIYAAEHGNLSLLRALLTPTGSQEPIISQKLSFVATKCGHLPCLQYAHEHSSPWDAATSVEAARGGHLHCLQYALDHGVTESAQQLLMVATYHACSMRMNMVVLGMKSLVMMQ